MQDMQTMIEEYVSYWGLKQHPFLLAPDSKMMCVTGQYFECLERLRYAINTNKGGVLVVSEDAGLGKTTTLLKLIDELKEEYGDAFKYAFIDHPTLTSSQMISYITKSIAHNFVDDDKLKNLMLLKDALIEVKERGGKGIIIVDEGQMLCDAKDVLQELRTLINLMHNSEYLHTFILSGQRALWNTIKGMPEFWQRLPVRYYFVPLRSEETKELVRYRLKKAGLDERRDIFADDALDIIHRYARGSPRTIIALSDLALLVGFTNRANKITFKEVSKAINAMSGKGETLPYISDERGKETGPSLKSFTHVEQDIDIKRIPVGHSGHPVKNLTEREETQRHIRRLYLLIGIICVIIAGIAGYFYALRDIHDVTSTAVRKEEIKQPQEIETVATKSVEKKETQETPIAQEGGKKEVQTGEEIQPGEEPLKTDVDDSIKKEPVKRDIIVVAKIAANVRVRPDINSPRIAMIFRGENTPILDEKLDRRGMKWYKIVLYGKREGWIADSVVVVKNQ